MCDIIFDRYYLPKFRQYAIIFHNNKITMSDSNSDETYADGIVNFANVSNDTVVVYSSPEEAYNASNTELNSRISVAGRHTSRVVSTGRCINSYSKEELQRKVFHHEEKEVASTCSMKRVKYELRCCQAILRQYCGKLQNVRKVAMAGIARDDMIMESPNSIL